VIHSFLLVLKSSTTNLHFLDTDFHRDLYIHGWNYAYLKYFQQKNSSRHAQTTKFKPSLKSATIIIPIHINDNHWIALVRRTIETKTYFFYSDDLNSSNSEETIRSLYSPNNNTCSEFHPAKSEWINVISYTYIPNSYKCGPRSLLAMSTMALHPNPSPYMLLPLMDKNIGQISRWWVANTIITASLDSSILLMDLSDNAEFTHMTSLLRESQPANLASLLFSPEAVSETQEIDCNSKISLETFDQITPSQGYNLNSTCQHQNPILHSNRRSIISPSNTRTKQINKPPFTKSVKILVP
jgi:hypothetical protein